MRLYPFMFSPTKGPHIGKTVVVIAQYDLGFAETGWMQDEVLGEECLTPQVDLVKGKHVFTSEANALQFIRNWWIAQGDIT